MHMSEANKTIFCRYFEEVLNTGYFDLLMLSSLSIMSVTHPNMTFGGNPDHMKQIATTVRTSFPNVHLAAVEVLAEDDRVVRRWTSWHTSGRIRGYSGMWEYRFSDARRIYLINDGQIAEVSVAQGA